MDRTARTISRFTPAGAPADFSALGTNTITGTPSGPFTFREAGATEIAVDNSGGVADGDIYVTLGSSVAIFAASGTYLGSLTEAAGEPFTTTPGVTTGPNGEVFVADGGNGKGLNKYIPTSNPPTNADFVERLLPGEGTGPNPGLLGVGAGPSAASLFSVQVFGKLSKYHAGPLRFEYTFNEGPGRAIAVDPTGGGVLLGLGAEVVEYDAAGAAAVEVSRLAAASSINGLAAGPSGLVYVSRAGHSTIEVWDHVPTPTVAVEEPDGATTTTVQLNGSVNPESVPLEECKFEYGLTTSPGYTQAVPCSPEAGNIPVGSSAVPVVATATGLQLGSSYRFRLVARNENGSSSTTARNFTVGQPNVLDTRSRNATQSSAALEAEINPNGFATSYHFEWGPTTAYGHRVPAELDANAGDGFRSVGLKADLAGLDPATIYHFRVVATSDAGTVR